MTEGSFVERSSTHQELSKWATAILKENFGPMCPPKLQKTSCLINGVLDPKNKLLV
jgi:hypothetical protein